MWSVLIVCAGWIAGWVAFGRPHRLPPSTTRASNLQRPALSVIVPARNEEMSLGELLADLRSNAPEGTEVIVVDDQSSDTTAALAAGFDDVTVLSAGDRPPGWTGKSWACHLGARAAGADALCFVDADVRLGAGAIESVTAAHDRLGGLISIQPWHTTVRPYEQASAIFGVVALMGAGTGEHLDHPCAFGPVLMTSRTDYESVGGHAAALSEVVEDVVLGTLYRSHGLGVSVFTGGGLVQFRMYPKGLRSLVEGFTKNFASGAANTPLWRLVTIVLWLSAMGTAVAMAWHTLTGTVPFLIGFAAIAAFVVQLRVMFIPVGRFGWLTAAAFPLLMVTFFAVFFRSLWYTLVRHEVRWSGRALPLRADHTTDGEP